jgi:hypothetical protein
VRDPLGELPRLEAKDHLSTNCGKDDPTNRVATSGEMYWWMKSDGKNRHIYPIAFDLLVRS